MLYILRYAKIIVAINFIICSIIKQTMAENVRVLGGVSLTLPLQSVISALTELPDLEMPRGQFMTIYRIELQGTVFYSQQYERVTKRNSYTVVYRDNSTLRKFGAIQYFLYVQRKVIAILKPLSPIRGLSCKEHFDLNTTAIDIASFLHPVNTEDRFDVCFAESIVCKCLFIDYMALSMLCNSHHR